jgi:hypothetical protein
MTEEPMVSTPAEYLEQDIYIIYIYIIYIYIVHIFYILYIFFSQCQREGRHRHCWVDFYSQLYNNHIQYMYRYV